MPHRITTAPGILAEALLVVVLGAGFAFAANELSPRGLKLARNYFPGGGDQSVAPPRIGPAPTNENTAAAEIDERLKKKGLQPVHLAEVTRLFHDPTTPEGLVVFVDARDEDTYNKAHIPGAWHLDPYHPEGELSEVLTACQMAGQIVVYCAGGDCEDADSTAIVLRDAGTPAQKLFVYGGGFDEWSAHALPLEHGLRNSGNITGGK